MVNGFYIASVLLSAVAIIILVMVKVEQNKPEKKYRKDEIEAFMVFAEAITKGVELELNGTKCKSAEFGWFYANGKKYKLNIENYLRVLKGENYE